MAGTQKTQKKAQKQEVKLVHTTGKRKVAKARAVLKPGRGVIRINKTLLENYEPRLLRLKIMEPLEIAGREIVEKVDISVTVRGGGISGQAEAARQAIARALVEWTGDEDLKKAFLAFDRNLLVYDPRRTEPHKESRSSQGPRRQRQSSKR